MSALSFFQKKALIILVISLSCLIPSTNYAITQEEQAQMQQAMQQNPALILVGEMFDLVAKVDQAIQFIAIQIKQNNVKGVKNHLRANKALLELKSGITQAILTDQILFQVNPIQQAEIIASYAHIISDLIDHIEFLLNKKFTFKNKAEAELARFDIVKSMQRASKTPLAGLPAILQALQEKVAAFEKNAHEIALTGLNKFSRKINQKIVTPWNRWNMTQVTKYATLGGIFTTILMYKFGTLRINGRGKAYLKLIEKGMCSELDQKLYEEWDSYVTNNNIDFNKNGPLSDNQYNPEYNMEYLFDYETGKFREPFLNICNSVEKACFKVIEKLGLPGSLQESGWDITSPRAIGMIGSIDQGVTAAFSHAWPLVTLLGQYGYTTGMEKWNNLWYPWLARHTEFIWNQMLGGAHKDINVGHTFNVIPDVTLDDIIGMDEVKDLFKHIIEFVINPEPFYNAKSAPPIRLLLSGPTRTGKTFIVEGLAGSLSQAFVKAGKNPDELKYWPIPGIAVKKFGIQYILEEAKKHAPIVLFIDEVDLLNLQRGHDTDLLGDFLTGMGNNLSQDPTKPVVLIVATNRPETLDQALLTPGRLGKEIRFEYPPFRFRKRFLIREFEKMALDTRNFDIDSLSAKTDKLSFEDLRAILRGGMIRAWSRKTPLTQAILEESLDTEIRGIITANRKELPENEKHILASHFAGQSLAYHLFDTGKFLDKVTLKAIQTELEVKHVTDTFSRDDSSGRDKKIVFGQLFTASMGDSANLSNREQVINKIKVLVAGFMAEEILVGSCGYTCHPEFESRAYDLAKSLVIGDIDIKKLSEKRREAKLDEVYDLLEQCKREVYAALEENLALLELITKELKEHEGLTNLELQEIIDTYYNHEEETETTETVETEAASVV